MRMPQDALERNMKMLDSLFGGKTDELMKSLHSQLDKEYGDETSDFYEGLMSGAVLYNSMLADHLQSKGMLNDNLFMAQSSAISTWITKKLFRSRRLRAKLNEFELGELDGV